MTTYWATYGLSLSLALNVPVYPIVSGTYAEHMDALLRSKQASMLPIL